MHRLLQSTTALDAGRFFQDGTEVDCFAASTEIMHRLKSIAACLAMTGGQRVAAQELETVSSLNVAAYLGRWFQVPCAQQPFPDPFLPLRGQE